MTRLFPYPIFTPAAIVASSPPQHHCRCFADGPFAALDVLTRWSVRGTETSCLSRRHLAARTEAHPLMAPGRGTDGPIGDQWRRSSKCTTGVCVEARLEGSLAYLRDSKQNNLGLAQPILECSTDAFVALQRELAGLAQSGLNGEVSVEVYRDGWLALRSLSTGVTLHFDSEEISAFVAGVRAGEFLPAA